MILNHLNLTVTDVPAAAQFLETYFGLRSFGSNNTQGFMSLIDESKFVLSLTKAEDATYPQTFHIGFSQDSEERANEIYQHLKADGFQPDPPERAHRVWTFYVHAPGGFVVEICTKPALLSAEAFTREPTS